MKIPGLSEWKVFGTLGHAQSHISLYRESDRVLIGGDHFIKHMTSTALIEPPFNSGVERAKSLIQYTENLKKCALLPINVVFPGHGEQIDHVTDLVKKKIEKIEERTFSIKSRLKDNPMTCFEIAQVLFPKKYKTNTRITISEVLGHLDLLIVRGEIIEEIRDKNYYYRVVI